MLQNRFSHQDVKERIYANQEPFFIPNNNNEKTYTLMMPPPNVTGTLHLGHALNGTLQDVLARWKRMQGYSVLWQPGIDHAGIATQMVVERHLQEKGIDRKKIGRQEFINHVWEWKQKFGDIIVQQQRRLGLSASWNHSCFTMDEKLSKAVIEAFVTLYEKGLIYQDQRLVNWDSVFETAISDIEVLNKEEMGTTWYILYPFANQDTSSNTINHDEKGIIVATTRPETLFGDVAVAVHPDDDRYQNLIGKHVCLPLTQRTIPIIADEYCDREKGSGAVKITPAHDFNDFLVGKRHHLEPINILDTKGHFISPTPLPFQAKDIPTVRKEVLDALKEKGLLIDAKNHVINKPYGDRSNVEVQPRLTQQWFVDAKKLSLPALDAVLNHSITFFPDHWKKTYISWLENIEPWCISRQIWWGHQIPAWYGPDQAVFVARSEKEAIKKAMEHYGKEVPLTQETDVLDTWFSSSLWPFSTLGWPDHQEEDNTFLSTHYPTDVLITGFDIIFFWVARMVMMGIELSGRVPFHNVYLHSLVRDEKGQKMSKSKGNIIDPLKLLDEFGVDPVRFTLCSLSTPGRDVKLSKEKVEESRNFVTKIYNVARFFEMQAANLGIDFSKNDVVEDELHPLSQWIRTQFDQTCQNTHEYLCQYRFDLAAKEIYRFLWNDLCDIFLEGSKPFYTHSTQAISFWAHGKKIFLDLLHLAHPFMPIITDYLYQYFTKSNDTLTTAMWPFKKDVEPCTNQSMMSVQYAIRLVEQIRSIKGILGIGLSKRLDLYIDTTTAQTLHMINLVPFINHLARVNVCIVEKNEKAEQNQSIYLYDGSYCYLLHLGSPQEHKEILQIVEQKIKSLENDTNMLEKKLDNNAYKNAKPDQWESDKILHKKKVEELKNIQSLQHQLVM
jgi:valyl-tRNA synthetase